MPGTKTLRFAFVAAGSSLLLKFGFAVATVQQLDGTGTHAAVPVMYAQELLAPAAGQASTPVPIKSPAGPMAHKLAVSPNRVIAANELTYLRLSLGGGMVFSELASGIQWSAGVRPGGDATCTYDDDTTDGLAGAEDVTYPAGYSPDGVNLVTTHSSGGSPGDDYVVFRLDLTTGLDLDGDGATAPEFAIPLLLPMYDADAADPPAVNVDANPANDIDDNNNSETCDIASSRVMLWVDVKDHLAIPAGAGAYTASISLHVDPDDAQVGVGATPAVAGKATIVEAVDGLDVAVKPSERPAIAHVGTSPKPYLRFQARNAATGVTNKAVLGYARAQIGREHLLNPATGLVATSGDLISDNSLTFSVEGDFSVGAFNLLAVEEAESTCPNAGAPTAEEPVTGNLRPAADGPANMAMLAAQGAGTYHLCVQVDVQGPNSTPIPAGTYNGTIIQGTGALARNLAAGVIGRIGRNGTTVKLPFLTAGERYNQRLVIVNDGANDARYDIGQFVTEESTSATPQAMASGMVPAGGQLVVPVRDIVSFWSPNGRRHRAAATLSMNADVDDVQVATTQVNLVDGSTDTVVYATVDDSVVR